MTLILSMATCDYCVQISDRRLTVNGLPDTDAAGKATLLTTPSARVLMGFAGLARAGRFTAQQWLLQQLSDGPVADLEDLLERLRLGLTEQFAKLPATPLQKRFALLVSGFTYIPDPPDRVTSWPVGALISNFEGVGVPSGVEARAQFDLTVFRPNEDNPVWLKAIGARAALHPPELAEIGALLKAGASPKAVVNRAQREFLAAADRPLSQRTIGKRLTVAVLPVHPQEGVRTDYVTDLPEMQMYSIDEVRLDPVNGNFAVRDMVIKKETGPEPMTVPPVGGRQPRACGSGKRYKNCHGR